jgi:glycosyltransferase involved in cell wall biosynthesis
MKYSFIIPCYNSEKTIKHVLDEIHKEMDKIKFTDYEIIAVNDCSPDNVYGILKEIASYDKKTKVINLAKNAGKHAAVLAGMKMSSGKIIINLDDDGQCPLNELNNLLQPLDKGYDIAIAKYERKRESLLKRLGSKFNSFVTRILLDKPKNLYIGNFSAVKRFVVNEMLNYTNPYPYLGGLFLQSTSKIVNVNMIERERSCGKSNYSLKKSIKLWLNGFTAFSVKPLRISSLLGICCAIIGFIFGIVTVVRKLVVSNISIGWSSTVSIMLFIGGLIMLMLGMIGEYIGRIYISINNSPQYVIKEKINFDSDENEKYDE